MVGEILQYYTLARMIERTRYHNESSEESYAIRKLCGNVVKSATNDYSILVVDICKDMCKFVQLTNCCTPNFHCSLSPEVFNVTGRDWLNISINLRMRAELYSSDNVPGNICYLVSNIIESSSLLHSLYFIQKCIYRRDLKKKGVSSVTGDLYSAS